MTSDTANVEPWSVMDKFAALLFYFILGFTPMCRDDNFTRHPLTNHFPMPFVHCLGDIKK